MASQTQTCGRGSADLSTGRASWSGGQAAAAGGGQDAGQQVDAVHERPPPRVHGAVAAKRQAARHRLRLALELERLDASGWSGIDAFYGVSRDDNRDERIICFAEVGDVGTGAPHAPDLALFEERFHEVIEAMRSIQGQRDPDHRLQWNRLYLFVRQPIALTNQLLTEALRASMQRS